MIFEYFIGGRYLMAKHKRAVISLITVLPIAGVAVGVMALIVVIAVMSGAESEFKSRILGVTPHVMLMRYGGPVSDYHRVLEDVKTTDGVEAATPFIYGQIMLRSSSGESMAVVKGVDPETAGGVIKNSGTVFLQKLSKEHQKGDTGGFISKLVLGKVLAKNLNVTKGDIVFLLSAQSIASTGRAPVMKRFKVADIFGSGMYEYDKSFAYLHIKDAQDILGMKGSATGIEVRVKEIYNAERVARHIADSLGFPYWTKHWMEMHRNLFSSLKLQKTVMFIILTLIVLVAAFNIAGALIMVVMEKIKDIAILKTMGATDGSIGKIFVFQGMVIGSLGTILGVCLGIGLCAVLRHYHFIELPEEVYHFTTLPVRLEAFDVFLITSAALVICFFATLYPARQAARRNPIEGLRYG